MRVIGIGDNVVDRYINKRIMFPGGNAVNFAVYAKQCGAEAAYLGLIADDKEGRLVHDSLSRLGIDLEKSPLQKGLATERCDVMLEDGDRVFHECSYGEGEYKTLALDDASVEYLRNFDVIHCGCYACMEDEMKKLEQLSAIKTYDFSAEEEYRTEAYLEKVCPYIDIALFSAAELREDEMAALRKKASSLGTDLVLITNGTKGQTLWDGEHLYSGAAKLVEPVDTMGAGDSFFTAFVVAMTQAGYHRGMKLTKELVQKAFSKAADFSAKTCLVEGAFGFGTQY